MRIKLVNQRAEEQARKREAEKRAKSGGKNYTHNVKG